MASNKREHTPPFEIMGRINSSRKAGKTTSSQDSAKQNPGQEFSQTSASQPDPKEIQKDSVQSESNWSDTSTPIVLRIPRGVIAIALVAAIGLLVIAYFVGHSMGTSSIKTKTNQSAYTDQNLQSRHKAPSKIPDQKPDKAINPKDGYNNQNSSGGGSLAGDNGLRSSSARRKNGLNYLVLATYPKDWALRLQKFMAGKGEMTILSKVGNNKYQVIAVGQGFSASKLGSQERQKFEKHMHALGRAWKKFNDNQGDSLGSMYFSKYSIKN